MRKMEGHKVERTAPKDNRVRTFAGNSSLGRGEEENAEAPKTSPFLLLCMALKKGKRN